MSSKTYYVYILTNKPYGTLYIGVTDDLKRRVAQHKEKIIDGFTKRYGLDRLVYYEQTTDVIGALAHEKKLKKWNREWKIVLIEKQNPEWKDLSELL